MGFRILPGFENPARSVALKATASRAADGHPSPCCGLTAELGGGEAFDDGPVLWGRVAERTRLTAVSQETSMELPVGGSGWLVSFLRLLLTG